MNLNDIHSVYFVGIGGIGMSGLARYMNQKGIETSGYDRAESLITRSLEFEGVEVHYHDDVSQLPENLDLAVYTPAIPNDHQELNYLKSSDVPVMKRSELLALIANSNKEIAVAGSHGKTTVTTMITHILKHSGHDCTSFMGGISVNYETNVLIGSDDTVVVEADEFDRSFHRLQPDLALVTAIDSDHLDIYGTHEALQEAFVEFAQGMKDNGLLIHNSKVKAFDDFTNRKTYSLDDPEADYAAENINMDNGSYSFHIKHPNGVIEGVKLEAGGIHDVENVVGAVAASMEWGVEAEKIAAAIGSFKGVKRRFEYQLRTDKLVYIDDYAHHPAEIDSLIKSARMLFEGRKVKAIFQPHLFTRTRDLASDFASSLSAADEVVVIDIYPAREEPIEGVTLKLIADQVAGVEASVCGLDGVSQILDKYEQGDVWLSIGAGDIDSIVHDLKEGFQSKL